MISAAVRPENSLPAFTYAIEQGVDVLELDLAVTKDDVLGSGAGQALHRGLEPEDLLEYLRWCRTTGRFGT